MNTGTAATYGAGAIVRRGRSAALADEIAKAAAELASKVEMRVFIGIPRTRFNSHPEARPQLRAMDSDNTLLANRFRP